MSVKEALFPAETVGLKENDAAFNQENFGLPPLTLSPLQPISEDKNFEPTKDYVGNFYNDFTNTLPEEVVAVTKRSTGFWSAIVLLLAICILGCYALYLYYPEIYTRFIPAKNQLKTIQPTVVPDSADQIAVTENQNQQDTSKQNLSSDQKVSPVEVATTIAKPATVEDTTATDPDLIEKSPYEIIGAAFKTLKGAKTFLDQLKSKGMQAKILKNTPSKATLITFGSFQDKESAKAALEKLHARDPHSEAYIQHYNK